MPANTTRTGLARQTELARHTGATGFTHLYVHSHYTLLGATPSIADLAEQAVTDGLSHLALTDTHALYGAVAFAKACAQTQVQPIIGMAVHMQPMSLGQSTSRRAGIAPSSSLGAVGVHGQQPGLRHDTDMLVLLAQGPEGYRSLCRLSSHLQADPQREQALARGLYCAPHQPQRYSLHPVLSVCACTPL